MTDCASGGERELVSVYLKGDLPEAEARAFEEHYFQCDRCAEAIAVGSQLRGAFGKLPVAPSAPARAARTWLPLAAAAVVALFAFGLWQLGRKGPSTAAPSVLRSGGEASLRLRVEKDARGDLGVSWSPVSQADHYVVRVLKPDARSAWSSETREARIAIDASALASAAPGTELTVQVEALDALRRVVATSPLVPLPRRRGEP